MGVLDFLKKKKDEQIDLGELGVKEDSAGSYRDEEFKPAFADRSEFEKPTFAAQSQKGFSDTDVQLILTRLELILQKLENMDRRLQIIEKVAKEAS